METSKNRPGSNSVEKGQISVEAIQQKRVALEARLAAAKRQKDEDLAKQLSERVAMVAEDKRLVPLIKEAKKTLKYFETQSNQGLMKDANVQVELEELRELVSSLEEQRREALEQYEAIMSNEEVNDAVFEQAKKEDAPIEAKLQQEVAQRNFEAVAEELFNDIRKFTKELWSRNSELRARATEQEQEETFGYNLARDACSSVGENINNPDYHILGDAKTGQSLVEGAEELKKKAGFFGGKKKAVAEFVLRHKDRLLKYNEGWKQYNQEVAQLDEFRKKAIEGFIRRFKELEQEGRKLGHPFSIVTLEEMAYEKIYGIKKQQNRGLNDYSHVNFSRLQQEKPAEAQEVSRILELARDIINQSYR